MDLPYSQQQQARRKNRSAGTLHQLSLAPLTTRLPVHDELDHADFSGSGSVSAGGNRGHGYSQSHDQLYTYFSTHAATPSYLQGKSAPTTPRLLSKSPPPSTPSRSHSHEGRHPLAGLSSLRGSTAGGLPKSRSTTHLVMAQKGNRHRHSSGSRNRRHKSSHADDHPHGHSHHGHGRHRSGVTTSDRASHNDWLFRTGALMTSETRETKGQSWLTARASSTSLTGLRDTTEEENAAVFEQELARERAAVGGGGVATGNGSRIVSRAGSRTGSRAGSRMGSRVPSRAQSRVGSRLQLLTPLERRSMEISGLTATATSSPSVGASGYFDAVDTSSLLVDDENWGEDGAQDGSSGSGPDFVNLDAKLEAIEFDQDTSLADEDHVRRLVKREKAAGSWLGSVFGWSLFSVQENGESDEDEEDEDEEDSGSETESSSETDGEETDEAQEGGDGAAGTSKTKRRRKHRRGLRARRFEGVSNFEEDVPPAPKANEGTWQDAAWLLSVASKVIL